MPRKKGRTCGKMAMAVRSCLSPTVAMSMPSNLTVPECSSMIRNSSCIRVDLPDPVRPTCGTHSRPETGTAERLQNDGLVVSGQKPAHHANFLLCVDDEGHVLDHQRQALPGRWLFVRNRFENSNTPAIEGLERGLSNRTVACGAPVELDLATRRPAAVRDRQCLPVLPA